MCRCREGRIHASIVPSADSGNVLEGRHVHAETCSSVFLEPEKRGLPEVADDGLAWPWWWRELRVQGWGLGLGLLLLLN